jgi:hypothetical protein
MTGRPLTCAEADELAVMCVLDALSPEEAAPLHEHLATCGQPHEAISAMAGPAGALASSVDPVAPPPDLRARVMAAVASTPQVAPIGRAVPAPIVAVPPAVAARPPVGVSPAPVRQDRLAWIGLAAAAVLAVFLLGWNLSLQVQLADRSRDVTALEAQVAQARQDARDAGAQLASLEQQLTRQEADLAAALDRADRSEAEVATLQERVESTRAELAVARQTLAAADSNITLASQAVAAAAAPGSTLATLAGAQPGVTASGFAIFPPSGQGYILLDGLPPLDEGTTYQAWYLVGDAPTSAGLLQPGPGGLTVLSGLAPTTGTDTVALTVEPAGGVELPTGPVVVAGQLPGPLQG